MLRFGTDGVRGDADNDLTTPFVVALGRAVARVLRPERVCIGRDTRASGPRIEAGLAVGLRSEVVEPVLLGVLPTPAIAFVAAQAGVPAAIVSASHNPWSDNGVKVIGADGRKLPDGAESRDRSRARSWSSARPGTDAGTRTSTVEPSFAADGASADAYVAHLLSTLDGRAPRRSRHRARLRERRRRSRSGRACCGPRARACTCCTPRPTVATSTTTCGSTHPELLRRAVVERGAALGLALDGDGDRVLAVDERGELVDGDQIMTMTAIDMHARGELRNDAIAVTVMSNLGLRRALRAAGIGVVETPVGDRHVVAAMQAHDLVLGGEQSGHIVYSQYATTGDGLLTGLLRRRPGAAHGAPAVGARGADDPGAAGARERAGGAAGSTSAPRRCWPTRCAAVEAELGDTGRVLVRASGTEPLVRVMIEADAQAVADAAAERLRSVVTSQFGTAAGAVTPRIPADVRHRGRGSQAGRSGRP